MTTFPKLRKTFWILLVLVIVFWALNNLGGIQQTINNILQILSPFIVGFGIAFVANLLVKFFEKHLQNLLKGRFEKWYRGISVLLAYIVFFLALYILIILILPDLKETFSIFFNSIPTVITNIVNTVENFFNSHPETLQFIENLEIDWDQIQSNLISSFRSLASYFANSVLEWIPTLINSIVDIFVSIVFSIMLLFSKERLIRYAKSLVFVIFNERWSEFIVAVGSEANRIFSSFISGQVIEGIITGFIVYFLMIIFDFPYALSISVLTGVTTLIPFYGAIIGGVVGALLVAMVDLQKGLWFVLLIIIVQQFEGNVLYPRVMGGTMGIPGVFVVVVVTIGGALFGVPGMMLAVPTFSLIYRIIAENVNYRLRENGMVVTHETKEVERTKI